jgi:hypothetical protein
MLNKHNDDRRHPIPKMTFTVTNWAIYEGGTTGRSTFAPSPKLAIECTYIAPTVQEEAPVGLDFLNRVYFENRSFSSSGFSWSLTQSRSATA